VDDAGQPATGIAPEARWTIDRADVGAVDSAGGVQGRGLGRARITAATPWGKQAAADLFVGGELLLSSSRRGGVALYQVPRLGADTLVPLYADSGKVVQAVRSPDATRIAFASNRAGSFDIYVMDADGQGARRLSTDPAPDTEPAWAPDGRRIFFTSSRGGSTQVYSMNLDGGDVRALTSGPGGNGSAAVSPDGKRVVFTSARDGNYELYETAPDGISVRRLTTTPDRESLPRFLPDGDVVYVSDRGVGARIMRLPAAGGPATLIAEVPSVITGLGVSRDGGRLAYVTAKMAGNRTDYGLFVRPVSPGGAPEPIRVAPGEQVVSPSF
jgi:Tol biopolymer transport system component